MQAAIGETISAASGHSERPWSPPAREQAASRKLAAIHEAGHVTVARALGFSASARIWPTVANSNRERCWLGSASPELFRPRHIATGYQRRMVACAGAVAESIYFNYGADADGWFLDPDIMSPTDWDLAECAPGCPDNSLLRAIVRAGRLLDIDGPNWPKLMMVARRLIIESRLAH
jgi:hypothetical protein